MSAPERDGKHDNALLAYVQTAGKNSRTVSRRMEAVSSQTPRAATLDGLNVGLVRKAVAAGLFGDYYLSVARYRQSHLKIFYSQSDIVPLQSDIAHMVFISSC